MEGRTILQWGLGGLGVALVLGYSYFMLDDFVRGPRLVITSPISGFSTTTPIITVSGYGVHTNNITMNGAKTPVDLEGNFGEQLILAPGYNAIQITAKDNYERSVTEKIEIVLVVPQSIATSTPEIAPKEVISPLEPETPATTTLN
ncbi:MAG: hypothetical protein M0P64_04275 [Candidatus Pacebacteria bacterium]|jgi:hypothetical protein|nr:hypothetical protein [Candidatus Paceibacterota bacterium]